MGWALAASAQNTIQSIRKAYQDVHEMIDHMTAKGDDIPAMPPEYFDLQVVQNLPATGGHKENIRMYYGELEPEEEGDPYPPHYLRFVTAKYNFAAREFYEEYLYDDKGQVMFIYAITPDVTIGEFIFYELRMWFDGKRLLRFTAKKAEEPLEYYDFSSLRKATFKEEYSGTTIPEAYSGYCSLYTDWASRHLDLFKAVDNNTHL